MTTVREQLRRNLQADRAYRKAFVCEHVDQNIPFQIRANREHRGWTQADLGRRARMAQARISVLEDPNYSKFTISTLKRLATAFDTGLQVAFVPVSAVLNRSVNLANQLVSPSADEDSGLNEESDDTCNADGGVLQPFEWHLTRGVTMQLQNFTTLSTAFHQPNTTGCAAAQTQSSQPSAPAFHALARAGGSHKLGTAAAALTGIN